MPDPIAENNVPIRVMVVDADNQPVDWTKIGIVGGGTPLNDFSEEVGVPVSTETEALSYTVPIGKSLRIQGIAGTGSATACFILKVNGVEKTRLRSSTAQRWMTSNFGNGTIDVIEGDIVTIHVTHEETLTQSFQVNLFGNLLTN